METIRFSAARLLKFGACTIALTVLALSVVVGCHNPVMEGNFNEEPQTGILVLTMSGTGQARSILPTWPVGTKFFVEFECTNDATGNFQRSWDRHNNIEPIELKAGSWKVRASAYLPGGENGEDRIELSRSDWYNFTVGRGGTVSQMIILRPVDVGNGQGTFSWDVSFSDSISSARMSIVREDDGTSVLPEPVILVGNGAAVSGSRPLDVGLYWVIFELEGTSGGELATMRESLHIYVNMESKFTDENGIFAAFTFPTEIVDKIVNAWDGTRWDFQKHGIEATHFGLLGNIKGIDSNTSETDFRALVGWFDKLSAGSPALYDKTKLGALIDAAFVGLESGRAGFFEGVKWRQATEVAIAGILRPNGTDIASIDWSDDGHKAYVNIGGYKVEISFDEPVLPPPSFTVTFDAAGGSPARESYQVQYEQTVDRPSDPIRAGYAFTGWTIASNITKPRNVTIGMWDSANNGWNNNAALRININGANLTPNARLASGASGTHPFTVNPGDEIRFYWVNGGQYDRECAFAVWYSDDPPVQPFNPNTASWSPSVNDPQGKLLTYLQYRPSGGTAAIGNGAQMGSFTAQGGKENFNFGTPITEDLTLAATWALVTVRIASTHILTAQGLELAFTAMVTPESVPQKVTWSVSGNDKASFDGNVLKVATDAKLSTIMVRVVVNGYEQSKDERTLTILASAAIAAASMHSAAIKSDGMLLAWGNNQYGQLGDGTSINSGRPGEEYSKSTTWVSVSAGGNSTVGIKSDGSLWEWGGFSTRIPKQEESESTWVSVSAGKYAGNNHTAAIKSDGTLWSWGANNYGQLGVGDDYFLGSSAPVQEHSKSTWLSVSAGGYSHTVAIKSDGTLWSWGRNKDGQLGDSSTTDRKIPVQEHSKSTWLSVSAGISYTVAIKSDGTLWAWGLNNSGQFGDNSANDRNVPVQEHSKSMWISVSAGLSHTTAIKSDGTLWSWGYGHLGNNTDSSRVPVQENSKSTWISVSAGVSHTVAIKSDGTLWAWGHGGSGQLGNTRLYDNKYFRGVPTQEYYEYTWRVYPR